MIHKFYENFATFQYKNIAACQVEPEIEVCVDLKFLIEIKGSRALKKTVKKGDIVPFRRTPPLNG